MKASDAFPSDYLKASDLEGKSVTVTIASVEMVEFGKDREKESKLLIMFVGKKRGLIINKTNSRTISKVLGSDETDDWIGKRIIIEPREVEYGSEMVWAIRVSLKAPGTPQQNTVKQPIRPEPGPAQDQPRRQPADQDGGNVDPDIGF